MSQPVAQDGFEIEEREELETSSGDRGLLLRLLTYLRPYRGRVAIATLLILGVLWALGRAAHLVANGRGGPSSLRVITRGSVESLDADANTSDAWRFRYLGSRKLR